MRLTLALAVGGLVLGATAALGAALTDADYRYVEREFGLGKPNDILADMTADEQSQLHSLINDPRFKGAAIARRQNVADYLFSVHMRECQAWMKAHPSQLCPPAADPRAQPGKEVADRQCNFCHLFGTGRVPSFHKLAQQGGWDAARLDAALRQGHQMSPIILQPENLNQLEIYIASLK